MLSNDLLFAGALYPFVFFFFDSGRLYTSPFAPIVFSHFRLLSLRNRKCASMKQGPTRHFHDIHKININNITSMIKRYFMYPKLTDNMLTLF